MNRIFLPVLGLISIFLTAPAGAQEVVASPWLDFREAKGPDTRPRTFAVLPIRPIDSTARDEGYEIGIAS